MRKTLAIAFALVAAGCNLVPDHASCDFRPKEQECTDLLTNRNNQLDSTLQALCVGSYSDNLCNHTGALGGCECDGCENGKSITWYFPDAANGINSASDVMKKCGTYPYVAP